ncbi:uncharacterized protein G2W53_010698 [Senna tora]|uniref:Myb/SANT-like domain-containing protein n=1 Tax=Senna tora TaxID=362788 RepID=A0A834X0F9_9FABA|nr:uncharacterized protein G2W53_010698 [Senna tora]
MDGHSESSSTATSSKINHIWMSAEDELLVQSLLSLMDNPQYYENGSFKGKYLGKLEEMMEAKAPGCGLRARPHIQGRIRTLKANWSFVYDMVNHIRASTSGFGWDDHRKCVVADEHVWEEYLRSHSRARPYRHKAFPHFDALTQLWAKDRATGGGAVSAHEDIEYSEGGGVECGAEASSGSRKRKRCSSTKEEFKEAVREMTENMGKMFTTATRELVSSIAFARNMSPDVVAEAVMFVQGLTVEERQVAHLKIAYSLILWRMFNEVYYVYRAKRHKGKNTTVRGSSSNEHLVDEFFTSEEQRQNYVAKFANRKVASSIEASGYMFGDHQSTLSKINGYDAQIVLKSLLAQPPEYVMDTTNFAASKFTFQNCLLHHIVQDCVTNKQGNHAYASAAKQFIMYCICSDEKFNLPYFILEKMTRCSKTTSLSLSYASLISWILEKNGINPLTDEFESPSAIDVNSLYNMRFTYDDHQWIEKPLTKVQKRILEQREREEAAQREREATHAADGSSSQPPAEGPVNSEVLSAIQHLQRSVDESFVQVNTRLNEFCTRIEALEVTTIDNSQMIKEVERRFGNQH